MNLLAPALSRARGGAVLDASLYDRFASKYATLTLAQMTEELRGWTNSTPVSQSVAAMARLLDVSLMAQSLSERDRCQAARLSIVLEQIVRRSLPNNAPAITTIEGAYRLLLHYGEAHSPHADVIAWMRAERCRRGMPSLD